MFLMNVLIFIEDINMLNNAYDTFEENSEIIFYLFLKENINDVNKLYCPKDIMDQDSSSLISELYKPS